MLCSQSASNLKVATDAIHGEFIESLLQRRRNGKPNLLIVLGIPVKPVKIDNTNTDLIEINPEKPLVFFSGQNYALLKPDKLGTRIVAKGIIH